MDRLHACDFSSPVKWYLQMGFVSPLGHSVARSFPGAASWLSLLFCMDIRVYSHIESQNELCWKGSLKVS